MAEERDFIPSATRTKCIRHSRDELSFTKRGNLRGDLSRASWMQTTNNVIPEYYPKIGRMDEMNWLSGFATYSRAPTMQMAQRSND